VCIDLALVLSIVSISKALSDRASTPTEEWVWFVGSSAVLVLFCVALPLRAMLLRQQRGLQRDTQLARQQAETDALTGLMNRRSLDEVVETLVGQQVPFSVSICDLDRFKDLNDTYGHDIGDRALCLFASALRNVVRNGDVVARIGGEEFVIILPTATKHVGRDVLDRARRELVLQVEIDGVVPAFTFSAGVADTRESGEWETLLRLADQRLLEAKREGRDRVLTAISAASA
jgi:diguanylate cyclase (GGDEF)-like protein